MPTAYDPQKHQLVDHPLYSKINTLPALQQFMAHHVICVWDFMLLVKSLQQSLTCCTLPWAPVEKPEFARFMNEIVLDEETDIGPDGTPISHFAWYLRAMDEVGANSRPIQHLITALQNGNSVAQAQKAAQLPEATIEHAQFTLGVCNMPLPVRVSVFYHAREALIPLMFDRITQILKENNLHCPWLIAYLERHMQCDEEVHGPLVKAMLDYYCTDLDTQSAFLVDSYTHEALAQRVKLWDNVASVIDLQTLSTATAPSLEHA